MLNSYSNPESRELGFDRGLCEGNTCDPVTRVECHCDNQFRFCLREARSMAALDDCSQGQSQLTGTFVDNDELNLAATPDLGNGVANPLQFRFITNNTWPVNQSGFCYS